MIVSLVDEHQKTEILLKQMTKIAKIKIINFVLSNDHLKRKRTEILALIDTGD